jgi:hypothetical protein
VAAALGYQGVFGIATLVCVAFSVAAIRSTRRLTQ